MNEYKYAENNDTVILGTSISLFKTQPAADSMTSFSVIQKNLLIRSILQNGYSLEEMQFISELTWAKQAIKSLICHIFHQDSTL